MDRNYPVHRSGGEICFAIFRAQFFLKLTWSVLSTLLLLKELRLSEIDKEFPEGIKHPTWCVSLVCKSTGRQAQFFGFTSDLPAIRI